MPVTNQQNQLMLIREFVQKNVTALTLAIIGVLGHNSDDNSKNSEASNDHGAKNIHGQTRAALIISTIAHVSDPESADDNTASVSATAESETDSSSDTDSDESLLPVKASVPVSARQRQGKRSSAQNKTQSHCRDASKANASSKVDLEDPSTSCEL
jgi:hypothetical protein